MGIFDSILGALGMKKGCCGCGAQDCGKLVDKKEPDSDEKKVQERLKSLGYLD
ncbi:hypothetical protein ACFLRF_03150 [Candidatus Altiarchaeota archaeon]